MAKKKIKITRLKARAQESTGESPTGGSSNLGKEEERSMDEQLMEYKEALKKLVTATPDKDIIEFASKVLRYTANDAEHVCSYMLSSSTSIGTAKYFIKELEEYLKLHTDVYTPTDVSTEPRQDSPGEEEKNPQIPEKLPDDSPEQGGAEIPEWEPYMSDDDDPVKFMVLHFKEAKQRLENMLDRLTVCESRLDIHEGTHVKSEELERQMSSIKDTVQEMTRDILSKMPIPNPNPNPTPTGEEHGTYTIKYPDGKTKKLKEKLPACWKTLLDLATTRQNIFLAGPTQCGKTKTAEMLADALGLRFASLSCSEGLDESIYAGSLLPVGKNGEFVYVPSQFIDFYENGGVFLWDEFCASDSNLGVFTNNATGNDHFYLPRRFENPLVKRHPDFICIAADNTLGHGGDDVYVGRNQMDGSTMERFRTGFIVMDYSPAIEKSVSDPDIYEWGMNIRKGIRALSMNSRHMTTRTLKQFTILKNERKWDLRQMEKIYFADWPKADVSRLLEWIKRDLEKQLAKAGGTS